MNKDTIVFTNENCIGCNKCIKVCSAIGACLSREEEGKARIEVDGSKCVACGSCIDVCVHGAREFNDDTERFFRDLQNGEEISLLLAPAFKANYPEEYETVLGGLKELGVKRIISVSFGADITTWGYLNYIKEHNFLGGISQPCPAVVSYIERYIPELIPKLFPVHSPLMCAAIYARKELGIKGKFAFISPCIAKKLEIDDPHTGDNVQYNVTLDHLMRYVKEHNIKGSPAHSEIEYGLGSFYPTPGGLAENVKWFLGDDVFIRQIEGERHLYEWMHQNTDRIKDSKTPFLFIDALNCEKGCICGTAVDHEKSKTDDALYALLEIREASKKNSGGSAWSKCDTPEQRLAHYNEQFKDLDLNDYLREYTDRSAECKYVIPSEEELEDIFVSMNKLTKESREIDCTCCGYESCRQMATAIHNGFNHKENCIHYEKDMVKELEVEKAIAEEATQAKSSFLANMSHEIRTPINAVLGMNEMILRECEDDNILAYSESIKSAGNTLLGLVNNILDFSKIEAGKMEICPVDYDLSSVVNDLVNMIQTRADNKGLILSLDIDPTMPKMLHGDEIRVKQIITNMLTNGVKYTEKGTITFHLGFEKIAGDEENIILKVCVEDTGIGIKPEDISRLFEKFDRIEEERNRNIEGTGLGMNITQKLLELMDSTMNVHSVYGEGSKFSFDLKQKVVKWDQLGDYVSAYKKLVQNRKIYKETFTAPNAKVLVIDDNPMNLVVFKSLLKRTLVQVDTANSGDEGLTLSYDKKYDIIFFDHMMPEKDGIQTLHEMRARENDPNENTPCVCLTANAISGAREHYIEAGFDDYLTKPIDASKLEAMLIDYLPKDLLSITEDKTGSDKHKGVNDEAVDERLAALNSCKEISIAAGLQNSGSVEDYLPLLKIFYLSMDDTAATLDKLFNSGNIEEYTIKVHALKSSARIIGATDFGEDAQALENAGKKGDFDFIRANHWPFMDKYKAFKPVLSEMFAGEEEQNAPSPKMNIVLISYQSSVVVKGIEKKLVESGHSIINVVGDLSSVRELAGGNNLFITYLPGVIKNDTVKIEGLKAVCDDVRSGSKDMIIIGDDDSHRAFSDAHPEFDDYTWMNRPVDMAHLYKTIEAKLGITGCAKPELKKVLVIDDDPSFAMMVREWIKDKYRVEIENDPEKAVDVILGMAKDDPAELILLDFEMPKKNGPAVLKEIRENPAIADTKVVVLSGLTDEEIATRFTDIKPEGFLKKSSTRVDILDCIGKIL